MTLRLTTHNLEPYTYYNEHHQLTGLAYNVISCAVASIGWELKVEVMPWARAQLEVKSGAADGFFAASHQPERDQYAILSNTIAEQNWVWFWPKGNNHDTHSEAFKALTQVSSFLGANMQDYLHENGYQTSSSPPVTTKELILMVMADRIDVGLANQFVLQRLLNELDLNDQFHIQLLKEKPLGVYISHAFIDENPGFLPRLNSAILECQ